MSGNVVIIGAGHAGSTAAAALRENGWDGGIHLFGGERRLPYQRPPLSKGYLHGTESESDLLLRSGESFARDRVELHLGTTVESIDRDACSVTSADHEVVPYETLILATGSAPRSLSLPGSDLAGIHVVRTVEDSDALRTDFRLPGDTVFIGGGFLNLEVAVEAVRHGRATVLEVAPQILGRVLSPATASALEAHHVEHGLDIRCGAAVAAVTGALGVVTGVALADGEIIPAARVVVSVGAEPRDELARACGLATAGGISVDARLRTSDPRIFAIGDCARYPNVFAETDMRVESVQNATDQARHVAAEIAGGVDSDYSEVPWFWSTQGDRRLQIAGIAAPDDEARVVERGENGKLVVERLRAGRVSAVETINAPGAHMRARRTLADFPRLRAPLTAPA